MRPRVESPSRSRCGEIASDLLIILVTVTQLIFFVFFYEYIAWYSTGPDGGITRQSLLTDDYFTWLPFPIAASILVILASVVMILYTGRRFRQGATISFNLLGIMVVVALLVIFPLDFSVIPNAGVAESAPIAVRVFFVLLAVFYAVTALIMLVRWRRLTARQGTE
jgi:hypothetical protein